MNIKFSGFDWDTGNWTKSLKKHGVSYQEAEEVLLTDCFVYPDKRHSTPIEKRYVVFGETEKSRLLFISFTMRGRNVRVISVRPMSQKERRWYEEEKKKTAL